MIQKQHWLKVDLNLNLVPSFGSISYQTRTQFISSVLSYDIKDLHPSEPTSKENPKNKSSASENNIANILEIFNGILKAHLYYKHSTELEAGIYILNWWKMRPWQKPKLDMLFGVYCPGDNARGYYQGILSEGYYQEDIIRGYCPGGHCPITFAVPAACLMYTSWTTVWKSLL